MSSNINAAKDFAIKAADWVEAHPWWALGTIVGLSISAFAALVASFF